MKKIINSKIFAFILGAVLFSGITVYATNYLAKDVTYKDTNVENALNDLYENMNNDNCVTGTVKHNANTQLNINLGITPNRLLMVYKTGSYYNFDVYDKNLNNMFYYGWYGPDTKVEMNDRLTIKDGFLTSNYASSWMRYTYAYDLSYMACE